MKDKIIAFLMRNMRIEAVVAIIVEKNGKILLIKRAGALVEGGKWCLPGGHINKWERAKMAAKREMKEELGVIIKNAKQLFVEEIFIEKIGLHVIAFVFSAKTTKKFKPNFEVSEYKWFDINEIERLNMAFSHKKIIKKFLKLKNEN